MMGLRYVYDSYASGSRSWVRKAHGQLVGSPRLTNALFGVVVQPSAGTAYFDLTTILLHTLLKERIRRAPDLKLLEIGVGKYAVLSGSLGRFTSRPIDAVDKYSQMVEMSTEHARRNRLNINVFQSDLFENVTNRDYDIVFWNLPYYVAPARYLPGLFRSAARHLVKGGELIVGYNTKPLPRAVVLENFEAHQAGLELSHVKSYWWNLHDVLFFRHSGAEPRSET